MVEFCGLMGFFLAGIHARFSLNLLGPAYFAKYFEDGGQLNLQGELGVAAGVVSLFLLMSPAITTLPTMSETLGERCWKRGQSLGSLALVLVVIHLVALGFKGWLAPQDWHGGLPSITLLACLAALAPLVAKRILLRR